MPKIFIHRANSTTRTADHRLDFVTPATDAERRERIQEVVRNTGCTSAVALRWLEAEEWIVDTTVRELKHAMRLGFTVDAADPVAKMDDEVRAAYSKLCEEFTAGRNPRAARSEFIRLVYKYREKAGRDHPLSRVMDSAAPTADDAPEEAKFKSAVTEIYQKLTECSRMAAKLGTFELRAFKDEGSQLERLVDAARSWAHRIR